jgi:uncharacterized repeat protein (TIGR03803 family)
MSKDILPRAWLGRILINSCAAFLIISASLTAQTLTTLHQFTALNSVFLNNDGAFPSAGLVQAGSILYGTAAQGGTAGGGTLFKINMDATGFGVLHAFTPANPNTGAPGDGAYPLGALILSGNALYGTTSSGGASDSGIVFKINIDGTAFVTLHAFTTPDPNTDTNTDGAFPWAGLILLGNTLYGTATQAGDSGAGTIFKVNTDGTGFARLHSFSALDAATGTNNDGAYPLGGVILFSNTLFGTTYRGGALGTGTVFRVNLDGSGFLTLHSVDGGSRGSLLIISNSIYGTTESGGTFGGGTVFKLNIDGTGFTNLQNFANDPGNGPWAGLTSTGTNLFGTTYGGGDSGQGSIFTLNLDGTGFTNLYSFASGSDGAHPQATVTPAVDSFFGTASEGGSGGDGAVFRLALTQSGSQQLQILVSGHNAVLSWPTNATGLSLQATTNLASSSSWIVVTTPPVVVDGLNTITDPITTSTKFYRLAQ